jgi:4-amino-4-deoxy-L-arabinose transferase-like glycosyltransferase
MLSSSKTLPLILLLALILRLAVGLAQDHELGYESRGNDTTWYLAMGYALATGFDEGNLPDYGTDLYPDGYPIMLRSLPTPPLYLLFVGIPQTILPREAAVILIRVLQALMGTATCYLVYQLGRTIGGDARAGLVAAGALAIAPVFILEAAQITSETLYIFLIAAALTVYVKYCIPSLPARLSPSVKTNGYPSNSNPLKGLGTQQRSPFSGLGLWLTGGLNPRRSVILTGALLGLATLTRAALLLFPLGLVIHLLLIGGWRAGLKRALLLLLAYALVAGSWTAYNLIRWNRLVIGGEGFAAFLYVGATDAGWQGPDATDATLSETGDLPPESDDQQDVYLESAGAIIRSDPVGYLLRRGRQLAESYLQPHGTLLFGGASLRDLVADWLREDRSLSGLNTLLQAPGFWPKLSLYIFHYAGLLLGIVGIWLARRRWRVMLPLLGFIAYTTLLHLFLDAIPRYIFPTLPFWYVFAGVTLAAIWRRWRGQADSG